MSTEHRKNLGMLADEEFTETVPDADGTYCRLILPAPVLQTQFPENHRPVKFYFAVHMILPEPTGHNDYFLIHGDQIGDLVFICAIYEDGYSIPNVFLCLGANAYIHWMLPPSGQESVKPPATCWELCNSVEFCRSNISLESFNGLKIHIDDPTRFGNGMLAVIKELLQFRSTPEYKMLFQLLFNDGGNGTPSFSNVEDDGTNGNKPKEKTKKTPAPLIARPKLPRGKFLSPTLNMNALANDAQLKAQTLAQEKAAKTIQAAEAAQAKAILKAEKAASKKKKPAKESKAQKRKRSLAPRGLIHEEFEVDEASESEERQRSIARGSGSRKVKNETTDGDALLKPLVTALTDVLSQVKVPAQQALIAHAPTQTPTAYKQPLTKTTMLEESKAEHTFRHQQRMDDLEFYKGLNEIKFGQQTPQSAISQSTPTNSIRSAEVHQTPKAHGTDCDDDQLQEAWKLLNSPTSWSQASEKDTTLIDMLGIKSFKDLQFLDKDHKIMLLGKLKVIPAKKFAITLKLEM
jgi:hypothetical protein